MATGYILTITKCKYIYNTIDCNIFLKLHANYPLYKFCARRLNTLFHLAQQQLYPVLNVKRHKGEDFGAG